MLRKTLGALAAGITLASLAVAPASANNAHRFCLTTSSKSNVLIANNTTTAKRHVLKAGQCTYGDWMWVTSGHKAISTAETLGGGWHYKSGVGVHTYRTT